MLRLVLALCLVPLLVGGRAQPGPRTPLGPPVPIRAERVALDPADPGRRRFGALVLAEAWQLDADDPEFGGLSTLAANGRVLLALSDSGGVVRFRLSPDGTVDRIAFGDLAEGPGDGRLKEARDSEAMARAPDGDWWVAFERSNAIARYDAGLRHLRGYSRPPAMRAWPANSGAEAMVALDGGRVAVFREGGGGSPDHPALLFLGDPAARGTPVLHFAVRPPAGFRVVDAARLPDGRIVALHRRIAIRDVRFALTADRLGMVGGWSAMIGIYDPGAIAPGAVLVPRILATLAPPLAVDNFEGIAVDEGADGTSLWIVSDDNKLAFQRTLLVRFLLP